MRRVVAALAATAILMSCAGHEPLPKPKQVLASPPAYDYPINNPYAATIIGVPPEMKVDYSSVPKPAEKTIVIFKNRPIPEGFWYQDGFKYGELLQPNPAPLVYVIAGTGADSKSDDMLLLANILYSGGYSVVLLPSPTHPNFIINASRDYIVGRPGEDAEDLYRAMKAVDARIMAKANNTVTKRMLLGYSLGGLDAAFTAKLDSERKALNFSKVLLINPPYSLYSSMQVIDHLLYRALPDGIDDADHFIKTVLARLSNVSQSADALDFKNERLLIDAYNKYQPNDDRLATTIGLSFRLAGADMIFTADVMSHSGYIFPKNLDFTTSTSLNGYLSVALRTSFKNYFDELYTEKYMAEDPRITRRQLIEESGLATLKGYFASHPEVGLITNRDDITLAKGEIDKLVALFGVNATVFPNGGHIGNLGHPVVAYRIVQFLGH